MASWAGFRVALLRQRVETAPVPAARNREAAREAAVGTTEKRPAPRRGCRPLSEPARSQEASRDGRYPYNLVLRVARFKGRCRRHAAPRGPFVVKTADPPVRCMNFTQDRIAATPRRPPANCQECGESV